MTISEYHPLKFSDKWDEETEEDNKTMIRLLKLAHIPRFLVMTALRKRLTSTYICPWTLMTIWTKEHQVLEPLCR
jgi:hypothetical protein